jgi:hypothetical protein
MSEILSPFGEISGSHGGKYEDESSGMLRPVVW